MKITCIKKSLCAILVSAIALSFSACKSKEIPLASKDNVFTAEEIEIPVKLTNINFMRSDGEKIYLYGSYDDSKELENGEYYWSNENKLVILDINGNLIKENTVSKNSSDSIEEGSGSRNVSNGVISPDGKLWTSESIYKYDPVTFESDEQYFFVQYDSDGNKLSEISLADIKKESNRDYFYINSFTVDGNGNVYFVVENIIYVMDSSGKLLFKIEGEESGNNSGSWVGGIYRTNDGKIIAHESKYTYDNNEYKNYTYFNVIDIDAKGYSQTYESTKYLNSAADGNSNYDLVLVTDSALKGYNLESDSTTTIIDWLQSGFDTTTMQSPMVLADGRILCSTYKYTSQGNGISYSNSDMTLSILTKVDPSEIPDKKLVKIATWYLDYNVKRCAVEFNKNNMEYQIEVISYMEDNGWQDAITKLNNDLIAGNIPDILIMNSYNMPVDSYIAKGMLTDIYKLIEKDEELNKEDYLQNIFDAYSMDGKLYSIIPSFSIQTVIGKTSDVGEKMGWTMDDLKNLAAANPDKNIFNEMTKANFLNSALYMSMDSYMDRKTGVCNFNSDEFIKLLEFANTFPAEINYDELYKNDSYYKTSQAQYRDGTTLLNSNTYINRFQSIREHEKGMFGEPITFIGFPSTIGTGSAINADLELAIMAKAKNPDGAWEFCRYFLTDEYQDNLDYTFPVKLTAIEKLKEKAKEKPFYMNGDEKVEYENTYWMNDNNIEIGVNDDADNAKMMELILSVKQPIRYDQNLNNIITEESEAYFSGQKSASEIADIIQNRVSVYVNESR